MALIFISHSSKDKDISTEIKNQIEAAGFDSVFLDHDVEKGIRTGEQWEQRLYAEMRASHILLILLSPAWAESKWCFAEYTHAKSSGKEIIPLIIEQDSTEEMRKWIGSYLQYSDMTIDDQAIESVIDRIRELSTRTQDGFAWTKGRSPYPGMVSFEEGDASIFFARDREVSDSITKLKSMSNSQKFKSLMIVGASGMGKSSLLKAGITPRLKRSYSDSWVVLPLLTPSQNPISDFAKSIDRVLEKDGEYYSSLCEKLEGEEWSKAIDEMMSRVELNSKIPEHSALLLPIDQAENLYTTSDSKARERFIHILSYLIDKYKSFFVIWTLRSDFLKEFQSDKEMDSIIKVTDISALTHIDSENIADIISKPALIVHTQIEANLVEKIRVDMQTADALPLVALVLSKLYDQHIQNHTPSITLETYTNLSKDSSNPLESIIQETAESAIADHTDEQSLKALKDAFIPHLVRINDEGQYIKRIAKWSELPLASHDAIDKLIEARLLIKNANTENNEESTIEVSHEALLRKWSRLQAWLVEEQEFLIGKTQLEQSLSEYDRASDKQKAKAYLTGLRLQKASKWLDENYEQLTESEREYIRGSKAFEAEQAQKRKRLVMGSFVVVLLFALFAGWQWMESQENLKIAVEEEKKAIKSRNQAERLIEHILFDLRDKLEPLGKLDILKGTQERVGEYYRVMGDQNGDLDTLRRISVYYNNMGDFYLKSGDIQKAKESYERALQVAENLAKQDPTNSGWQRDLSVSYYKFYTLQKEKKYLKKAVEVMREMRDAKKLLPSNKKFLEEFEEILANE